MNVILSYLRRGKRDDTCSSASKQNPTKTGQLAEGVCLRINPMHSRQKKSENIGGITQERREDEQIPREHRRASEKQVYRTASCVWKKQIILKTKNTGAGGNSWGEGRVRVNAFRAAEWTYTLCMRVMVSPLSMMRPSCLRSSLFMSTWHNIGFPRHGGGKRQLRVPLVPSVDAKCGINSVVLSGGCLTR